MGRKPLDLADFFQEDREARMSKKATCWRCEREQSEKQFTFKDKKKQVSMGRNDGHVVLVLTKSNVPRKDGMKLCSTCKRHILNEAADAIVLDR